MAEHSSSDVASHRACASCRNQKVRCIPDNGNPDLCQRCARSGRPCVFTPLQKRKQRKRTDTRVAELEREMRTMRSMLKNKPGAPPSLSPQESSSPRTQNNGLWYTERVSEGSRRGAEIVPLTPKDYTIMSAEDGGAQSQAQGVPSRPAPAGQAQPQNADLDIVDRGLVTIELARKLLDSYRTELFPHYPMVHIPDYVSVDELRRTKPILFLAIIAAAAGKEDGDLSLRLDKEVLRMYAMRQFVQSEKSLEIVQALLISAVWYHPPAKYGQLKYYEYIRMATTIAFDIGIGTRPTQQRARFENRFRGRDVFVQTIQQIAQHPAEDMRNPDLSMAPRVPAPIDDANTDTASTVCRRTFLAVYNISAGVSLSLRRPNILRMSSYVHDCLDYLDNAPDALPTDRILVAWTGLVTIGEEISQSFCYDDPGGITSISEFRTQLMLKDFEKRLTNWSNTLSTEFHGFLPIMYYTVRLYLFEIALHVDHSPDDFRAPYQMGVITAEHQDEIPTSVLAEAIADVISTSHKMLEAFIAIPVQQARALPVFAYVRVSFAAFVLAKLSLSASSPQSRIGHVLDKNSLKAEAYLNRSIYHVREVVSDLKCRVPAIFLALLFKLRQWCLNPDIIAQPNEALDVPGVHYSLGQKRQNASDQESSQDGKTAGSSNQPSTEDQSVTAKASTKGKSTTDRNAPTNAENYTDSSDATSPSFGTPGSGLSAQNPNPPPLPNGAQTPWGQGANTQPFTDQMQFDDGFLQYLGDVTGFPEGGLTGLDDWVPEEMMDFGILPDTSADPWQPLEPGAQGMY